MHVESGFIQRILANDNHWHSNVIHIKKMLNFHFVRDPSGLHKINKRNSIKENNLPTCAKCTKFLLHTDVVDVIALKRDKTLSLETLAISLKNTTVRSVPDQI